MKLVGGANRRFLGELNRRRESFRSKQRRAVTTERRSGGADGAEEIDGGGSPAKSRADFQGELGRDRRHRTVQIWKMIGRCFTPGLLRILHSPVHVERPPVMRILTFFF